MINKKHHQLVFVAIMALGMGFVMSLTMTALNLGITEHFIPLWLRAFALGSVVAFPSALVISPLARKLSEKLTADKQLDSIGE